MATTVKYAECECEPDDERKASQLCGTIWGKDEHNVMVVFVDNKFWVVLIGGKLIGHWASSSNFGGIYADGMSLRAYLKASGYHERDVCIEIGK